MNVPFALRPRRARLPADALLFLGDLTDVVFAFCREFLEGAFPPIFATADGLLVKLPRPMSTPAPGAVRLRAIADNLFVPVDADLVPALLADEAQALTAKRGLIFLPGSRALAFAADQPLAIEKLLRVPRGSGSAWRSLPEPPKLAEELVEVSLDEPPRPANDIVEQGRQEIGSEASNAGGDGSRAGPIGAAAGAVAYGLGRAFVWIGEKFGSNSWAAAGARMLEKAFGWMPALTQKVLGQQEDMLRRLLEDFQNGNIEKALRRALPIGGDKPGSVANNARLPTHNLAHSIRNLLGGRHGPGSYWLGAADIQARLAAEYRKQAELAARRGDVRRAAFIYAKLLHDFPSAARILSQGGLHRDAAILYEEAVRDLLAAAREWEAAGEIEKALAHYVAKEDHLAAGDLLQRVGEPERALVHYRLAADRLVRSRQFDEAGRLLETKAHRPDLAAEVWRQGWNTRPQTTALPCGTLLAEQFVRNKNSTNLLALMSEAEEIVPAWDAEPMSRFFDRMVLLADEPALAEVAEELRDRCLVAQARKMEQLLKHQSAAGVRQVVFPATSPWPAPLLRDAEFAIGARVEQRTKHVEPPVATWLAPSTVRAVCQMPYTSDLFLGFENGLVVRYRVSTGERQTVLKESGRIVGLACDRLETTLTVLIDLGDRYEVAVASRTNTDRASEFRAQHKWSRPRRGDVCLFANADVHSEHPFFGVRNGAEIHFFRSDNPSWHMMLPTEFAEPPLGGLLGPMCHRNNWGYWCLLLFSDSAIYYRDVANDVEATDLLEIPFGPVNPSRNTLAQPPITAIVTGPGTLLAGWLNEHGEVIQLPLPPDPLAIPRVKDDATRFPQPGLDGSFTKSRTTDATLWDVLQTNARFREWFPNPIAAFSVKSNNEILVVDANGSVTRMPLPPGA
jgi:tetratricopeptide (TPR) repeat protein